ncbi:MAG: hypothetical protein QW717_05530 [Candidatus Bathyarchaeia archaeon]
MRFKPIDVAVISVFAAMWVVLNLTLGPMGFRLFNLPILCDFSVFFTLLLTTWTSGRMGTASAVGVIGAVIVLALSPSSTQMVGFLASAVLFDLLMLLSRHKLSFKLYNMAVAVFATAVSAYFAGVVIGTIFMRRPLQWALTFWGVWHLIGGIISIIIAIPVIGTLERAKVKEIKSAG